MNWVIGKKQKRRNRIKAQFGKNPMELEAWESLEKRMREIRMYEELVVQDVKKEEWQSAGSVDTVTWNDLEMDRVFARINHTRTYMGEQILYHRLCLGHSDLRDLVLLTVKIRNIHAVKIHQDQFTNADTRQCGRYVRAKSAQSTNSNCCSRKCFLPFLSMAHRERRHPFFLCGDSRALFPVHRHFINHLLQS